MDFISNILRNVRFTDILDIGIVTFIVYKILGFIRETRAQQLVKGLIVILLAFFLSDILKLYTLNWILKGTMTMGIIAIVIVFQPELRRGLEYMGRGRLVNNPFGHMNLEESKKIIKEIVDTVKRCSESRTGALIVIERQVSLSEYAETGTILNADISSQLLCNIFYEGAPLHDGAVIIRGKEIYAAGCILPLTEDKGMNRDLGTRHRAAVGISEVSDAITLVVSEETGVISVTKNGSIKRFLDIKSLEKILFNIYTPKESEEQKFVSKVKNVFGGK